MQLVTQGTESVSKNYSLHCLVFFPCIMLKKITQPCLILLAVGHFILLTGSPTRTIGQKMFLSVVKPVSLCLGWEKEKKSTCDNGINEASTNKPHIHYHSFNFFTCTFRPFFNHSSNIKDIKLPLPGKTVTEGWNNKSFIILAKFSEQPKISLNSGTKVQMSVLDNSVDLSLPKSSRVLLFS